MEVLQAVHLIEAEDLLPQGIENADIAFFSQFDVEATAGRVRIDGVGLWLHSLFYIGDDAGAWEGDVINPYAVVASLSAQVLVINPFEHMATRFKLETHIGPVVFARPPVFFLAVDEESENVLVEFGRGLEPEADFAIGEDIGIGDQV